MNCFQNTLSNNIFKISLAGLIFLIINHNLAWTSENNSTPRLTKKISYQEIEKIINEKNELIEASQYEYNAHQKRNGYLTRSFLPQLTAEAGREEYKTGGQKYDAENYWKIEAKINLLKSGKDSIENEIRKQNVLISATNTSLLKKNELKEAQQAYWQALALNQHILDTKEAIEKNKSNLKSAKNRVNTGLATTTDLVQFELHQVALERSIKKLELEKDLMLNKLSVALALDEHENIEIIGNFPEPQEFKINSLFSETEQKDLIALKQQQKISHIKAKKHSNWWLPQIDIYSQYQLPALSDDAIKAATREQEWATGVKLTLDLGQGYEQELESSAHLLEAQAAQLKLNHRKREIMAQDHELKHDLKVLKELISFADKDIELAHKFLKLTENEYIRGVSNGPDLLEAFKKYFDFKEQKINYYKNFYQSLAELESLN